MMKPSKLSDGRLCVEWPPSARPEGGEQSVKDQYLPNRSGQSGSSGPQSESSLPNNSLLFSLWRMWESSREEPQDTLQQSLEKILLGVERPLLPLNQAERNTEYQRVSLRLQSSAVDRYRHTRSPMGESLSQIDAKPFVHVALNRMAAWILVFPPMNGGQDIRMEQLQEALRDSGVLSGVSEAVLLSIVETHRYFELLPVAWGTPSRQGADGYLIETLPHTPPPIPDSQWPVDPATYLEQRYLRQVRKGDVICEAAPPRHGEPGMDVSGMPIPARSGKPIVLSGGQNTTVTQGAYLVADTDGHVFYKQGLYHVQPHTVIEGDLTEDYGQNHFPGDVTILGDIPARIVLQASGSIIVHGLVEGAVIEAGGDVIVADGVLGDDRAMIRAKGAVRAKYLENCVIYAGGLVETEGIIGAHVYSNDRIHVLHGRGTVIGGKLSATHRIDANIIGSMAERLTEITLGEMPFTKVEYQDLGEQLERLLEELTQVTKQIDQLEQTEDISGDELMQLAKLRMRRTAIALRQNALKKLQASLDWQHKDLSGCTLSARTIYPVTRVTIGGRTYNIKKQTTPCTVRLDDWVITVNGEGVL